MHDTGCDEIFIIVTDLKRQEMDDVTEYFKLVCRHCFGTPCKPSVEKRIQSERTSALCLWQRIPVLHSCRLTPYLLAIWSHLLPQPGLSTIARKPTRSPALSQATQPTSHPLFPSARPNNTRHPIRKATSILRSVLTPNNLILPNLLHPPLLCAGRRHLLRLPYRLPKPMLHRRLRDDPVSQAWP